MRLNAKRDDDSAIVIRTVLTRDSVSSYVKFCFESIYVLVKVQQRLNRDRVQKTHLNNGRNINITKNRSMLDILSRIIFNDDQLQFINLKIN